jgi:hypothetical protein
MAERLIAFLDRDRDHVGSTPLSILREEKPSVIIAGSNRARFGVEPAPPRMPKRAER